jgi:hypothetical protein
VDPVSTESCVLPSLKARASALDDDRVVRERIPVDDVCHGCGCELIVSHHRIDEVPRKALCDALAKELIEEGLGLLEPRDLLHKQCSFVRLHLLLRLLRQLSDRLFDGFGPRLEGQDAHVRSVNSPQEVQLAQGLDCARGHSRLRARERLFFYQLKIRF